ncbi:hypothetical protein CDN99_01635 [Roseateles aquatilis]|uniref:TonB C-terminal domain-containing protein n=1 Tax=Roseateles aquatilis TaxID=431061 RepID=A0A246JKZ7_9BURK|nr:hypothetical protein [Roseateles aquatilis]OWQ93220.1 hypothetical protein CDN99_01635 [Roseateles aquatilis]
MSMHVSSTLARIHPGVSGRLHAPSSRTTGLALVALVHVAMVAALINGMHRRAVEAPPPIEVRAIKDDPKPPEPVVRELFEPPPQPLPKVLTVPVPEVQIDAPLPPPTIHAEAAMETKSDGPVTTTTRREEPTTGAPPLTRGTVTQPGLVCTSMGAPDLPATNWSGEAVFRAVADVQGGRVVAVQIQALSSGLDTRTRRSLSNAIETALKTRYVCPGEHRFQQDFAFKID